MKTLFLETTQPTQTLALWDEHIIAQHEDSEPKPSSRLHPTLQTLLAETNWKLTDIERLILTTGPGSFTGIRVGLAVAQALKLANPSLDLRTLTTFQAYSLSTNLAEPHTIILDSLAQETFAQTFSKAGIKSGEPQIQTDPSQLSAVNCQLVTVENTPLNIQYLCEHAKTLSHALQPLYLKPLTFKKQR